MAYMPTLAPLAPTATAISLMSTIFGHGSRGVSIAYTFNFNIQAGSLMALLLYKLFGLRMTFLVASAGLLAIDLGYLLLYHVALKRSENRDFWFG